MSNADMFALLLRLVAALSVMFLVICGAMVIGAAVNLYFYRRDRRRSR
jgi:hypothetical protein